MGICAQSTPAKLFVGLFSADLELFPKVKRSLERSFGASDLAGPLMDFTHTDYYRAEFGEGLKRQFIVFRRSVQQDGISRAKLITNRVEKKFTRNARRAINIDPGYLTLSKVVLLTTKDYVHRLYLGRGIYAEVTLFYKGRTFNAWPWTYPDYRTEAYIHLFNEIRRQFHKEMTDLC